MSSMRKEWSSVRRIFPLILKHCDSLPLLQHVLCYNDCNTAPSEQTGLCCSGGVFHHIDYSVNNFASALEKREIWDLYVWSMRVSHSLSQPFRLWDSAKRCEQEKHRGWGREWAFPSLSLSLSYPLFFPARWLRAIIHYLTTWNRLY